MLGRAACTAMASSLTASPPRTGPFAARPNPATFVQEIQREFATTCSLLLCANHRPNPNHATFAETRYLYSDCHPCTSAFTVVTRSEREKRKPIRHFWQSEPLCRVLEMPVPSPPRGALERARATWQQQPLPFGLLGRGPSVSQGSPHGGGSSRGQP